MRKTIYITDDLVLNRLSQEKNQSRYISDLIMKDIVGETFATEERVLQIIKQYFSTMSCTVPINIESSNIAIDNSSTSPINDDFLKNSIQSVLICEN